MTKRRRTHDDHQRPHLHHQPDDDFIPLPIQTFLWRQTSPFVRPFLGKARDLAQIEQRDACKLFERIIITNNIWGQSPSLTDAIASIDRWRLIKVSFPFVLQCTAALLNNKLIKDHNFNRLGGNEAKMMYTLQWILMNASEECADSENEAKNNATNVAIAAATAASLLKPSDISGTNSTTALVAGQTITSQASNSSACIGQQDQQTTIATAPQATSAQQQPIQSTSSSTGQPPSGRVGSTSSCGPHHSIVIPAATAAFAVAQPAAAGMTTLQMQTTLPSSSSVSPIGSLTPTKPLTPTNPPSCPSNYLLPISSIQMFVYYFAPIMDGLKHSDFLSSNQRLEIGAALWEPLFNHQLPDINCLKAQIKPQRSQESSSQAFFNSNDKSQQSQAAAAVRQAEHLASVMSSSGDRRRSSSIVNDPAHFGDVFLGGPAPLAASAAAKISSAIPEGSKPKRTDIIEPIRSGSHYLTSHMEQSALITKSLYGTYLDVAVLRCLFITDWQESGVFWALTYLSNRLVEALYQDEGETQSKFRLRSKSLSCIDSTDVGRGVAKKRDLFKRAYGKKRADDVHKIRVSQDEPVSCQTDKSSKLNEQTSGRFLRVEDAETSDSGDGLKEPKSPVRRLSFSSGMQTLANQIRKTSKRVKKASDSHQFGDGVSSESQLNISQGEMKSSTSAMRDRRSSSADELSSGQISALSLLHKDSFNQEYRRDKSMTESNPVITVTPNIIHQAKINRQKQTGDEQNPDREVIAKAEMQFLMQRLYSKSLRRLESLTRSQTIPKDLHFSPFETQKDLTEKSESVGANHYVDEFGRIDPLVVLKVLHSISQRNNACSQRVCDKILLLVTKLINIGILKKHFNFYRGASQQKDLTNLLPTKQLEFSSIVNKAYQQTLKSDCDYQNTSKQEQVEEVNTKNVLIHKMLIDIVLRLYHHMGCPNHCGMESTVDFHHQGHQQKLPSFSGKSSLVNDAAVGKNLRLKLRGSLEFLCDYNKPNFVKYVQDVFTDRPLQQVIDILHSTLGFCRPDYLSYLKHHPQQQHQPPSSSTTTTATATTHTQPTVQFMPTPSSSSTNLNEATLQSGAPPGRSGAISSFSSSQGEVPPPSSSSSECLRTRASIPSTKIPAQQPLPPCPPDQHQQQQKSCLEQVEGIIVSNSFKQLITRMATVSKELKFQENTSLYYDVRRLISFIRDSYNSTFRSIVLSALIDCTKLLNQQQKLMTIDEQASQQKKAGDFTRPPSEDESTGGAMDSTNVKLRDKHIHGDSSDQTDANRIADTAALSFSVATAQQKGGTGGPLINQDLDGSSVAGQQRTSIGSYRFYAAGQPRGQRQMSPVQALNQNEQQHSPSTGLLSLSKAKKKLEQVFGGGKQGRANKLGSSHLGEDLAISGSIGPADGGGEQPLNSAGVADETSRRASLVGHQSVGSFHDTPKMLHNHYVRGMMPASLGPTSIQIIKQNQMIYSAVQTGMANFSFLMESCLPGDFLDPALLAALLDLKSPIAIRVAIFLECANFVHRCNRGQWPSWMRMNVTQQHRSSNVGLMQSSGGPKLRKSSSIQRTARNNTIMYRAAGRAFYAWAEAVGARLEELIQQEQESKKSSDAITEDTENDDNQMTTSEQGTMNSSLAYETQISSDIDFLQPTLNGDSSPFALKMAACQLLFEVTTFLRETYRYLPPTIVQHQISGTKTGDKMNSIYDVSRAVTANRRWSMALSSLGFGQLPATLNALSVGAASGGASSGSGIHLRNPTSAAIPEHPERRISFILHETKDEEEQEDSGNKQEAGNSSAAQHDISPSQTQITSPIAPSVNSAEQQQDAMIKMTAGRHLSQSSASSAVVVAAATCLLRSSGVIDSQSHRRKSIKLKKATQEKEKQDKKAKFAQDFDEEIENSSVSDTGVRRTDSMRSRRRVSGISEKSDTSDRAGNNGVQHGAQQGVDGQQGGGELSGNESAGNGSCEEAYANEAAEKIEADESKIMSNMPWFKAISMVNSSIDCNCSHFPTCRPYCYKLHQNMCKRLISFVQTIYQDPTEQGYISSLFEKRLANLMNLSGNNSSQQKSHSHDSKGRNMFRAGSDCSTNVLGQSGDGNDIAPKRKDKKTKKHHQQIDSPQDDGQSPRVKKFDKSNRIQSMTMHLDSSTGGNGISNVVTDTIKALTAAKVKERKLEEPQIVKYMKSNVKSLLHCPMSSFLKGAIILPRENFIDMIRFSWNLLLEDDQQLSRTAAVCFIISSIKCPAEASKLLLEELESQDASRKMAAINKFYVVWDARYQCWPRLEDGAFVHFKMAPPSIEFTLPSPKIAQESSPVVDPPWIPRKTSNVEEVTIGQDQTVQKSFVTATKTRRKQQIELVTKALKEKHDKLREDREKYHITSVPITLYAAYEPTLGNQAGGDEMDGGTGTDDDTQQENRALLQMKTAQVLFPTCLCQAAIVMINLLDDPRVTYEGSAVYEIANKVIWSCLVEDPALFLRYFFERLTRQNQSTIFQVLRRLIRFMPRLPPQAAYTLYNYLIGFIIYYIRCPVESSQKLIADTLSVLCLVVPSVHGLFLKDLKQILRKEQCDHNLLITANVPSAKKIIVHGSDSSGIPSQFPIDETTQFYHILVDSLEFFGIEKSKQNEYFLIDVRTNLMHNLHSYVRDHYSFKRSQHPQLQLINMNPGKAFDILQKQEFINQFLEFGKVSMSLSIVKSSHMAVQRALFLHEELMKLPTFPRKALETNFSLFRGPLGHQVFSMDRVHKICWVRVIARMFELTSGFFLQLGDIQLFLNAISGIFVLHCEEASVSRLCLATFINATHQFKSIFATDGFLPIMSTIVQVYSNHQNNQLLCRSIEFVCKQFYIMHRKPFLLQLFGSVAPKLNTAEILQQNQTNYSIGINQPSGSTVSTNYQLSDPSRISPSALFRLLQSLEKAFKDPLDILELVDAEKPLRAVDFCYQQDKEVIEILDIISLCVTVTAYASESPRSTQMLIILESVVPLYMKHLQASTSKKAGQSMGKQAHKDELQKIQSISICIRTLIVNCEGLTRNFSGPLPSIDFRSSSIRRTVPSGTKSTSGQQKGPNNSSGSPIDPYNDEHSLTGPETRSGKREATSGSGKQTTFVRGAKTFSSDESEITRGEFIVPRDTLLNLVAEFLSLSTGRLVESAKKYVELHQKHSSYELLDVKSHLRLAEVANSLLKFASTDPSVMACRGLIRYMNEILPNTEWRQEAIRPALIMILKRLDKTFNRIAKKNWVKKSTDWEAAKQLLKGAYLTFIKHPYIVHLPHLKSLISCCQNIILSDGLQAAPSVSSNIFHGFTSSSVSTGQMTAQAQAVGATQSTSILTQQSSADRQTSGGNFLNVSSTNRSIAGGSSLSPSGSSGGGMHYASSSAPTTSQTARQSQQTPSLTATTASAALAERFGPNLTNSVTSQGFNSVTIRLIAMQLLQTGDSQTLESFIGSSMNTPEKLESLMLNLIYPMCIRVCSGAREAPKLRVFDILFILNIVLNMLAPQSASSKSCSSTMNSPKAATDTSQFILSKITTTIGSTQTGATALGIVGSSAHSTTNTHQFVQHQEGLKIGFLGLKILCVCFESQLASEWVRITRVIRDLALQAGQPSGPLWDFLDFVSTYRFPMFILLLPTIKCDLAKKVKNECSSENAAHYLQCLRMIEAKIHGPAMIVCRSKSFLFVSLTAEMRMLKEQLIAKRKQLIEGERQTSSNLAPQPSQAAVGSSTPNQSGQGADGPQQGGDHFTAYHRLSAAIASFANQGAGQGGKTTPSASSSQQQMGTSAALKGTCFAAQLATSAPIGPQLSDASSTGAKSIAELRHESTQGSIRLSTAKSREEARKVMNTILRRTSYPHNQSLIPGEHSVPSTGERKSSQPPSPSSPARVQSPNVDVESGSCSGQSQIIMDPAMLMAAAFPAPRKSNVEGSGILKQLVQSIDRQNQKQKQQQQQQQQSYQTITGQGPSSPLRTAASVEPEQAQSASTQKRGPSSIAGENNLVGPRGQSSNKVPSHTHEKVQ